LRDSCHLPAGTGVALETGTTAFFVARELVRLELKPVVIDAHEVRRKAHRPEQKSDTSDALELCEGLRRSFYRSIVHVPSPAISELRTALSRRRHFIRIQTAEVNAAKRLLRGIGQPSGPRGNLRTDAHWQRLLAGGIVPEHLEEHVGHHYAVWRQAAERVRALDLSLADSARAARCGETTRRFPVSVRSSRLPRLQSSLRSAALRVPSTRRAMRGSFPVLFNRANATLTATSPSAGRLSCARCCARQRIMRGAPPIH
jgi:transposase